jgi:hypothetical protein
MKGTRIINTPDLWRATEYMPHLKIKTTSDGTRTFIDSDGRDPDIDGTFEQIIQFRPGKLAKGCRRGRSSGWIFKSSTTDDLSGSDAKGKATSKYLLTKEDQADSQRATDFIDRLTHAQVYAKDQSCGAR